MNKKNSLLTLDDALTHMLANVSLATRTEIRPLADLSGRIIAKQITAGINAPPADNSAMDGYAIRYKDLAKNNSTTPRPLNPAPLTRSAPLTRVGKALAGQPYTGTLKLGQCIRIMTGATLPAGSDTVVMQENVSADGDSITVLTPPTEKANVRYAGEDIQQGELMYAAGHRLGPVDTGLLATMGLAEHEVYTPLKVAIFANGSELRAPGETLAPGEIYDSNRFFLRAMLEKLGCEVIDLGVIPDDLEQLRAAYIKADSLAHAVITCGGASVGEADYTRQLLSEQGNIGFWKVAIKPGKPFMFGHLANSTFFGLPGNPMSALVTFHKLVLPILEKMQGKLAQPTLTLTATSTCDIPRNRSRLEFLRGTLSSTGGQLCVTPDKQQSSGALSSFARSNCFILLDAGPQALKEGHSVTVELFDAILR